MKTLKQKLDGILVFNNCWFFNPLSGLAGGIISGIVVTAAFGIAHLCGWQLPK